MSLLQGRDLLVKGLRWQVQDGRGINFWEDKWIPSLPSFTLASTKPPGCSIDNVADVIDLARGDWNKELLD
jgi:hypothetical protein